MSCSRGFLIEQFRGRTGNFTVSIFDGSCADENLSAGDIVTVRIGRHGVCVLEIDSVLATDGDSIITFTAGQNDVQLRIGAEDSELLTFSHYDVDIFLEDISDGNREKQIDTGVLHCYGTLPEPAEQQSSSSS